MNLKTTIALFLILAGLGGFVYWTEIRGKEAREEAETKKDRVFDFKEEDVEKAEILTSATEEAAISLVRDGDKGWKIASPLQTEADKYAVDGFLSSLMYLTAQRDVETNPAKPETFGLKDPRSHITLWLKGKKEPLILRVGDRSGIGNSYYAMRSDLKKVVILDSSYESSLMKGVLDFRDKKIFPIDEEKAKRIVIRREKDEIVLERTAPKTWQLKQPLDVRAASSTVDEILRELKNADATTFVQEEMTDPKPYGLDKPQMKVTVDFEGSTVPADFLLGSKGSAENTYYARSSLRKPVVTINDAVYKALTKPVADFRENHPLVFDPYDAVKLTLLHPDKTITLAKSGESEWKLEAPIKEAADESAVDNVLYAAEGLTAMQYVDKVDAATLAAAGLDKPRLKLQVFQRGDKEAREIWVGAEDKATSLTYVKNGRLPYLFLVESDSIGELFVKVDELKKKPETETSEEEAGS